MKRRRMGVVAGVVALALGGYLSTAAPASADTDHGRGAQGVLINVTGDGTHASISNHWVPPGSNSASRTPPPRQSALKSSSCV